MRSFLSSLSKALKSLQGGFTGSMLIGMRGQPFAIACGVLFLAAHGLILVSVTFFSVYFGVALLTHIGHI